MALRNFPDARKIEKLKLLLKEKSKTDPSNYRSISLLLLLSNIFEGIVLDQTNDFLSLMTMNPVSERRTH